MSEEDKDASFRCIDFFTVKLGDNTAGFYIDYLKAFLVTTV